MAATVFLVMSRSLSMSNRAPDGLIFLIENGKITGALSETMFSANLAQMLQNVRQISKQTLCDGCFVLPWVKIGGITVSGK